MNPVFRVLFLVLAAIVAVRVDAIEEIETITKTVAMEKYTSEPTHIIHSESSPSYKHTHVPSHTVLEETFPTHKRTAAPTGILQVESFPSKHTSMPTHIVKKEGFTTYLRTSARSLQVQDMSTMEPSSTPTLEPI